MKLFVSNKHKKRAVGGLLIMAIAFMAFMPYGSFHPQKFGFWLSLLTALFCFLGTNWFISKYHAKE